MFADVKGAILQRNPSANLQASIVRYFISESHRAAVTRLRKCNNYNSN